MALLLPLCAVLLPLPLLLLSGMIYATVFSALARVSFSHRCHSLWSTPLLVLVLMLLLHVPLPLMLLLRMLMLMLLMLSLLVLLLLRPPSLAATLVLAAALGCSLES